MQLNMQPKEHLDNVDESIEIVNVWSTLQGEGPYAGTPAVFVRMAGCNLQCKFCDTNYTTGRFRLSLDLAAKLVRDTRNSGLVVITGGEPFRQKSLSRFVRKLYHAGYEVQIETNGTLALLDFPYKMSSIVCSPKAPKVHPDLDRHVLAYKYILSAKAVDPTDGLPASILGEDCRPYRPLAHRKCGSSVEHEEERLPLIYVQPEDTQDENENKQNMTACIESCLKHGYRLSVQLHKYLGLE